MFGWFCFKHILLYVGFCALEKTATSPGLDTVSCVGDEVYQSPVLVAFQTFVTAQIITFVLSDSPVFGGMPVSNDVPKRRITFSTWMQAGWKRDPQTASRNVYS